MYTSAPSWFPTDFPQPGRLANVLWTVGASLLHSGVVINKREYAFGGHNTKGQTGVYYTRPHSEPPGGTFKCEVLQGFTVSADSEIEAIIQEASAEFQGTSYNLLHRNCNHFTAYLCEKLTGRAGPGWLNRAASIGVAFPCVVPKEWIAPPDYETAEGELVDEGSDLEEGSRMLSNVDSSLRHQRHSMDDGPRPGFLTSDGTIEEEQDSEEERQQSPVRDTSGRKVPPAEIAPLAKSKRVTN